MYAIKTKLIYDVIVFKQANISWHWAYKILLESLFELATIFFSF